MYFSKSIYALALYTYTKHRAINKIPLNSVSTARFRPVCINSHFFPYPDVSAAGHHRIAQYVYVLYLYLDVCARF